MNVNIEHPHADIDEIASLVANGSAIRASPHTGNLNQHTNPHYMALGLKLGVPIELVNTITVDDRHGRPTLKIVGGSENQLISLPRKQMSTLLPAGVLVGGETLESLHLSAAKASGLTVQTSTDFLATIGRQLGIPHGDIMRVTAVACDSLMRVAKDGRVSGDPAKRVPGSKAEEVGLFGTGDDPSRKSPPHCCGSAVDVNILDTKANQLVDLGSPINTDSKKSHIHNPTISNHTYKNRLLLLEAMLNAGFSSLHSEWWHYSYGDQNWAAFYKKPNAIYGIKDVS